MHNVGIISFILNLPWTLLGLMGALLSIPKTARFSRQPLAIIVEVRSFWWLTWRQSKKGVRAMAQGNIILLSATTMTNDLEHELIHVHQYQQRPFIQKFLYAYQTVRYGYRNNKYEKEAYTKSGSRYTEA